MDFKSEIAAAGAEFIRLRTLMIKANSDEELAHHQLDLVDAKVEAICINRYMKENVENVEKHSTNAAEQVYHEMVSYELDEADANLKSVTAARLLADRAYITAHKTLEKLRKGLALRSDLQDIPSWISRIQPKLVKSITSNETQHSKKIWNSIQFLPDEILTYLYEFLPLKEWEQNERHINIVNLLLTRLDLPHDAFESYASSQPELFGFKRFKHTPTFMMYQTNDSRTFKCLRSDTIETNRFHRYIRSTFLHTGIAYIRHHLPEIRFEYKYSI